MMDECVGGPLILSTIDRSRTIFELGDDMSLSELAALETIFCTGTQYLYELRGCKPGANTGGHPSSRSSHLRATTANMERKRLAVSAVSRSQHCCIVPMCLRNHA
jgi:hypothetical protein